MWLWLHVFQVSSSLQLKPEASVFSENQSGTKRDVSEVLTSAAAQWSHPVVYYILTLKGGSVMMPPRDRDSELLKHIFLHESCWLIAFCVSEQVTQQMTVCGRSFHLEETQQPSWSSATLRTKWRPQQKMRRRDPNCRYWSTARKWAVRLVNKGFKTSLYAVHYFIWFILSGSPDNLNHNLCFLSSLWSLFREAVCCPSPPPPESPVRKQSRRVKTKIRWVRLFPSFKQSLAEADCNLLSVCVRKIRFW